MATNKRKADCTPEEWAAHLAHVREYRKNPETGERIRAQRREYSSRPETKEKRRALDAKPEYVARRRAYAQSEEQKAKVREHHEFKKATDPTYLPKRRAQSRLHRTGFTHEMVEALRKLQDNKCAICSRELGPGQNTHADHCHDSKKPRGLLCRSCNTIEGHLKKLGLSPQQFGELLAHYLSHPPVSVLDNPALIR